MHMSPHEKVTRFVWNDHSLIGTNLLVMLYLARHVGETGGWVVEMSLAEMEPDLRLGSRQIRRSLAYLAEIDRLSIVRTPGSVNVYTLYPPQR